MSRLSSHVLSRRMTCGLATVFLAAGASVAANSAPAMADPGASRQVSASAPKVVGAAPRSVAAHAAMAGNRHDPDAVLSLNIGLEIRNSAELDRVIAAASTPGNPAYGHYLTHAQYRARYA